MEKTLFVVVSDHGHLLGSTATRGSSLRPLPRADRYCPHGEAPTGRGAGKSSDYYASTHDVALTILGFLGVEQAEPMDGQDLGPS